MCENDVLRQTHKIASFQKIRESDVVNAIYLLAKVI